MFVSHNNAQLYAVEFGNGPRTLVAQGGWAGSWELWAEPFTILSKTWRTVAYDHRGTGATLASAESITFNTLVADLFAVLDALKIERCVLAAESAGVAVVLRAALEHPERFDGLVLIDGLYYRPASDDVDAFVVGLQTQFEQTIEQFVQACVPDTEPNRDAICEWGKKILMRSSQAAAINLYQSMDGIDLRAEIPNIKIPTLVVHGDLDVIVPSVSSEWLASNLPNSQFQMIRGAGHVPTMTHPREVAAVVNSFFAR